MAEQLVGNQPAIRVSGLYKHFDETRAVNGIDFEVPEGKIFALLGPNGAGKTTTISMIEGLLRRDRGEISVLGLDPWTEHDRMKLRVGVIPQGFNFFEKIVPLDAVRFYCDLFKSDSDPKNLLDLVALYDSRNTPFEKLSGGQKQKLGLALSLVNDPEVLFLDEPTTGLDPSSRRAIWNIIREFRRRRKTIVMTTHYMEEAEQLADIVAIISKGKIITKGNPEEIIAANGSGRKIVLLADPPMQDYLQALGVETQEEGKVLTIPLKADSNLAGIIELIEKSGIPYSQLTVRTDTLEDVFIKLVGKTGESDLK